MSPRTSVEPFFRPLGFVFGCFIWIAFPMPSTGDFAVGVTQGEVFMNWRTNLTDISEYRLVVNPYGVNIIRFAPDNVTGTAVSIYSNKIRDVGNVSFGIVSFRLLSLTVSDASRYYYKSLVGSNDGGQVLVIAGTPVNVSVMEVADPFEDIKYPIQCLAISTSVPPGIGLTMNYQWKNEKGQNITASDRYSFSSNQSTLIINPLKRQDAGTLVCEAWEHVGAVSQSGPFSLNVLYGPDPGSIQMSPNTTFIEVSESSLLTVNCSTDCFPDCQYRWTGPGGSSHSNTGLLLIISIGRSQTGQYTCTASNPKIPNKLATATLSVVVFCSPETPANLSVVPDSVTTHSLQLSWRAGFHGGASQTFVIEYREMGESNWLYKSEIGGLVQYVTLNTSITDLKDGTKYEFRIYSENVFNRSQVSTTINETTKTVPNTSEGHGLGLPVAGIAGGISAGIVCILVIGIGIFLWRRNQHKTQSEHDNDILREHEKRNQINASSIKQDGDSGKEYDGLNFTEVEASQYLQLNGITLEENRNVDKRLVSPQNDSYEKLHPYTNNDIQMYSSLKIPKISKDCKKIYENTCITRPDTTAEYQNQH